MSRSDRRAARRSAALAAAVVVLAGCIGGDDESDDATEASVPEEPVSTAPPERETPFCSTMIEVSERLTTDPPPDATAFVVESYEAVLADVPAEILPDFEYVLADLRGEPLPALPEPVAPPSTAVTDPPATSAPAAGGTAGDGSAPANTEPVVDEFFLPDDTPAERLSDYVDFNCRGNLNNPGPPATPPDVELPDPDDL